jgi:hypothetical protein
MVFVVRRDLAWSKQKLSVMTAHAALALFKKLYKGRNPVLMQWVSVEHKHIPAESGCHVPATLSCWRKLWSMQGPSSSSSSSKCVPDSSSACVSSAPLTNASLPPVRACI